MNAEPDPLLADVRSTLRRYQPADEAQAELREAFLAHLDRHPDGLRRECLAGHLTASALVVGTDGRVLLMLHAKVDRWLQMGGHLEDGDVSLLAAAEREVLEESGIDDAALDPLPVRLDRHDGPCHPSRPPHLDVQFLAWAPAGARPRNSAESRDLRWFDADTPFEDASVTALLTAAAARRRRRGR